MEFVIILLLLVLNGVFAMYEIALVSSNKARLETFVSKGNKSAKGVLKQLEEPEKFLSTIQIGITLIGIVSGAFGGVAIAESLRPYFEQIPVIGVYAKDISMITVVAVITYLSLIVGELVPKSIALSNPEKYATMFSPFMIVLTKISYPFVCLLSLSTKLVNKLIGLKGGEERSMTQEELKMILNQSSREGILDKEESDMLNDVFRFSDKHANDLMTHRTDVVALYLNNTEKEVLSTIAEKHFSKYLLLDKSIDNVVGVISVKDIILMIGNQAPFDLKSIAQPALFIPESLYAKKVLELFKKNKNKFGVVVNEYGGTEGIITLHDLTESVFGDILEENETEEEEVVQRQDGSFLVEGSMNIDDFMERMGIMFFDDLKQEDFSTVGGMAMFFIGNIPKAGDTFEYRNLKFEIMDMDNGRVDKLLVIKEKEE
ncbi:MULTISPECIES: hemolysin family protein [unclassified Bacteroides]|jgi:putative hemolysin|uniref:hemolysin family protein n=1 Tax=unclassified Bacteroides TaxID=2646097 RepID=UPI000E8B2203|nr:MULTISPECIES: hemolysin family protein [unclassified Bacteroides]RGN46353.1 HlyC/CorC family transporter [Bacteroides sp. OM05-12]RHR74753.1 HlyC/CorC family transporter [Bacteroides sp. AF16-49]